MRFVFAFSFFLILPLSSCKTTRQNLEEGSSKTLSLNRTQAVQQLHTASLQKYAELINQELSPKIRILKADFSGPEGSSGCVENTFSHLITPDQGVMSVVFDDFHSSLKENEGTKRRSCKIELTVEFELGYEVALLNTELYGYYQLGDETLGQSDVVGTQSSTYWVEAMDGRRGEAYAWPSKIMQAPPFAGEIEELHELQPHLKIPGDLCSQAKVVIDLELRLDRKSPPMDLQQEGDLYIDTQGSAIHPDTPAGAAVFLALKKVQEGHPCYLKEKVFLPNIHGSLR